MTKSQPLFKSRLEAENIFENFVTDGNEETVACLRLLCDPDSSVDQIYLSGATACGKSHLLQALCHHAAQTKTRAIYLPLRQAPEFGTDMLSGLETIDIICVDDVDALAGQASWEEALFNLINRIRSEHKRLLVAATEVPHNAGFKLADLSSRLMWGGVYRLAPLSDEAKSKAIQLRTRAKGHELPQEVIVWLLAHCSRDMNHLLDATAKLEEESILARRRITVPFARSVLSDSDG